MFVLVNGRKYSNGNLIFEVLDTDDLVSETVTAKELADLYKSVPDLKIKGVTFSTNDNRFRYAGNEYGSEYKKVSDDYGVVTHRRNGGTARVYYEVCLYKRGMSAPIYAFETPESYYDYLNFSFRDLDGRYFVFDINVVDKHYYGEDREEYLCCCTIVDISDPSNVNVIRRDGRYTEVTYADSWEYQDGKLEAYVRD